MKKLLYFIMLLLTGLPLAAQEKTWDAGVIDALKRDGRIYIVIVVIGIILIGLFLYMWRLDKKISRLEKESK